MSRSYPVTTNVTTVEKSLDDCEHAHACVRLAAMNGRQATDLDAYLMCRFCHAFDTKAPARGRHLAAA